MYTLGILRMPDIYMRIHAATKAGTVGIGLVLFAVALFFQETAVTSRAIGIMLFIILTTPAAAHVLGKIIMNSPYAMWRNSPRSSGGAKSPGSCPGLDQWPWGKRK